MPPGNTWPSQPYALQPIPKTNKKTAIIVLGVVGAFLLLCGLGAYAIFKSATAIAPEKALFKDMDKVSAGLYSGVGFGRPAHSGPVPIKGATGKITVNGKEVRLHDHVRLTVVSGNYDRFCLRMDYTGKDKVDPIYYDSAYGTEQYGHGTKGACGSPEAEQPDPGPKNAPSTGILTRNAPIIRAPARDATITTIEQAHPDVRVATFTGFSGGLDAGDNGLMVRVTTAKIAPEDIDPLVRDIARIVWETYNGPVDDSLIVELSNGKRTDLLGRVNVNPSVPGPGVLWQRPAAWAATGDLRGAKTPEVFVPLPLPSQTPLTSVPSLVPSPQPS